MLEVVNVGVAKNRLSRLLDRVEAGEEVVIGRAGHPIARLIPFRSSGTLRQFGGWRRRVRIAKDFDAPLEDEAAWSTR